ncbi:hypothetical protein NC651_040175 [Populus alba x Populus x berolinensis]|nr:hypothetical protein NC651_040175 [Populus alba x Populus x berolinensis]
MSCKWKLSLKELKKVSYVAAPMVAVTVLQYLMQVVSVMMVGHLDELSLSGISSASSFTSVTGCSLLFGLAGALEALSEQAYGAEQYQKLGTYTYCAIISLILVCLSNLNILSMDVHRQASYPCRSRPFNLPCRSQILYLPHS